MQKDKMKGKIEEEKQKKREEKQKRIETAIRYSTQGDWLIWLWVSFIAKIDVLQN